MSGDDGTRLFLAERLTHAPVGTRLFWFATSAAIMLGLGLVAYTLNEAIWLPRAELARLAALRPQPPYEDELYDPEEITFDWMAAVFQVNPLHPLRALMETVYGLEALLADSLNGTIGTCATSLSGACRYVMEKEGVEGGARHVASFGAVLMEVVAVAQRASSEGDAFAAKATSFFVRAMGAARGGGTGPGETALLEDSTAYTGFAYEAAQYVKAAVDAKDCAVRLLQAAAEGARLAAGEWPATGKDAKAVDVMAAEGEAQASEAESFVAAARNAFAAAPHVASAAVSTSVGQEDRGDIALSSCNRLCTCTRLLADLFYRMALFLEDAGSAGFDNVYKGKLINHLQFEMVDVAPTPDARALALRWLQPHGHFLSSIAAQAEEYVHSQARRGSAAHLSPAAYMLASIANAAHISEHMARVPDLIDDELEVRRANYAQGAGEGGAFVVRANALLLRALRVMREGLAQKAANAASALEAVNTTFASAQGWRVPEATDHAKSSVRIPARDVLEKTYVDMSMLEQAVDAVVVTMRSIRDRAVGIRDIKWGIDVRLRRPQNMWSRHGQAGMRQVLDVRWAAFENIVGQLERAMGDVRARAEGKNVSGASLLSAAHSTLTYVHLANELMIFAPVVTDTVWKMVEYIGGQAYTAAMRDDVVALSNDNKMEELNAYMNQIALSSASPAASAMVLYLGRGGGILPPTERVRVQASTAKGVSTLSLL